MNNIVVHFPALATMVLFLGAFLVTIFGGKNRGVRIFLAMLAATCSFVMVLCVAKYVIIDGNIITYWLGNWSPVKDYAIGIGLEVDALNAFFALLVTLTTYLSGWYSIKYMSRDEGGDYYYTLYLMLSGSVLGLVLTGDIFNMFVMIEIMTFACVALTAFRNWSKGALEAAFKYLVLGSLGSTCTLSGIAILYAQAHTLNMAQLSAFLAGTLTTNPNVVLAFALLIAGFGIKSYCVPFHFVAADAYQAAPASVSMLFSGMVNKAGVYGLIRICYIILQAMGLPKVQTLIVALGTISMFVGVTMALNQHDFKRLLAFHSISQIGYVLTAIGLGTAMGVAGGLYHAMNHTLFKGLLFLCAGAVYYATGTTNLNKMGGLSKKMPQTCIIFLIAAFSISGLPPFNGFVSKWTIYQAIYAKAVDGGIGYLFVAVVALITSVLTLASFIKVTQSAFFGHSNENFKDVKEVPGIMLLPMWILAALCVVTGVCHEQVTEKLLTPAVNAVMNVTRYVDTMMGEGYAAKYMGANEVVYSADMIDAGGIWNPWMWLMLFGIILVAFVLVAALGKSSRGNVIDANAEVDNKHQVFYGGEVADASTVVGSDLFWGFRTNFAGYFNKLEGIHSGVVNDYATWAVCTLAVVVMYLNAVL